MEVRTPDMLYDAIEKEYIWRIDELSLYKESVKKASNKTIRNTLIRGGVTILYAHWEGFIKRVADLYYEFVSYQKHIIGDLNNCFVSIILRADLQQLTDSKKLKTHNEIIASWIDKKETIAYFSTNSPIKTSNLNFTVFEDVCVMIGIDSKQFELKKHFIDKKLVESRNTIAHGNFLQVDATDFYDMYTKVIDELISPFKTEVLNAVALKKYLRNG